MRRREFITVLGGAALASRPLPAFAQSPSKRPLIATQIGGSKTETDRDWSGFFQGMRELGYVDRDDYRFEVRYADGNDPTSARQRLTRLNRHRLPRSRVLVLTRHDALS
jgi:putative ABC transport system substrate-binding protein